jgi:TRAP-type mannitol/chloroaromatic compound transport system permease small subunit
MRMELEFTTRLTVLEQKIDAMYASVEKLRKYFLWTGIITVVLFVLPLIGLVFAVPSFIKSYSQIGSFDQTSADSDSGTLNTLNALLQ